MRRGSSTADGFATTGAVDSLRPIALWLLVLLLLIAAGAPPVAMVSDLKGTIQGVTLFGMLPAGQELRLPAGAELSLSFVQGGLRERLKGPCLARLEPTGVKMLEGAPAVTMRPAEGESAALPTGLNLDKIGGLRRGELRFVNDPVSLTSRPVLRWVSSERFPELEIMIEEAGTFKRVLKQRVPPEPARLQVELSPGKSYLLSLTAFRADGSHIPNEPLPVSLRVLSSQETERYEALAREARMELQAHPEDLAPLNELLAAYLSEELFGPALDLARELVRRRSSDAILTRLVSDLEERQR